MSFLYNTGVLYNAGALYADVRVRILYYRVNPQSEEGDTSSTPLLRHIQLQVKHANGDLFHIRAGRVLARRARHTLPIYRASVYNRSYQRLRLNVQHSHGTEFIVHDIRAVARVTKRRLLD